MLLLFLFSQEFYFQIPEGTQKGGNILRLPFPQSQLWSSQIPAPAPGRVPDRHFEDGHDEKQTTPSLRPRPNIRGTFFFPPTEMISKTKLDCKAVLTLFCRLPLTFSFLKREGKRSSIGSTEKDFFWALDGSRGRGSHHGRSGHTERHIVGTWLCEESETPSAFLSLLFCFVNLQEWLPLPWA